jgi:hypothetical protein
MLDPWESLRVNARRQILLADNGAKGGGGPQIDIYDLSGDCRYPQLLASAEVGTGADGDLLVAGIKGHEGAVSPDGRTYYIGDATAFKYYAVDITNTTKPKVVATFDMGAIGLHAHGLSVSQDGNRVYAVSPGNGAGQALANPTAPLVNGFVIFDTSEVQARLPDPKMKLLSKTLFKDGSGAQHTIEMAVGKKRYMVMVDEGGSAGFADAQNNYIDKACAADMAPFPTARIYDIDDELKPIEVSKLMLETHDCKNAAIIKLDTVGLASFTYGSHYCSVDNRTNATALACSYFNSGVRVFDIRDPKRPKEIAYFNPPAASSTTGSMHAAFGQWRAGGPDWCSARLDFDFGKRQLVTSCQDSGMLVLQFAAGTWPFNESTPSAE